MIKMNRTTEYGLIALRHMSRKRSTDPAGSGAMTSAREIADSYGLPFEITAKTLQRLKDTGLIESVQGARGGYLLQKTLDQVTLADFLELMEGPQPIVACAGTTPSSGCEYDPKCEIKVVMNSLNSRIRNFLSGIRLNELADDGNARSSQSVAQATWGLAVGEEP